MIYLNLRGGAGNQFSEYAFARYLIKKREDKDKLIINYGDVASVDDGGIPDDDFLKQFKVYYYEYSKRKPPFIYRALYVLNKKCNSNNRNRYVQIINYLCKKGVYSVDNDIYVDVISSKKNLYLDGNFENHRYYDDIRDVLLKEFDYCGVIRDSNMLDDIVSTESVCISIRKWKDEVINGRRKLCSPAWYRDALSKLTEVTGNNDLKVFVFADDIDWAKTIDFGREVVYEKKGNDIPTKVKLMSSCKHFILSNSTFSWWAQYLSDNNDKYVILPNQPLLSSFYSPVEIPAGVKNDRWICMDVY